MLTIDTTILKHQPDHLKPLSPIDRAAAAHAPKRQGFIALVISVFWHNARQAPVLTPAE